jgi:phosphatidylinositol alpha-1,6-mannosyltransferase
MPNAFLFITRNYPPQVGGLENYSYHLIREFENQYPTYKITLSRNKKHLPWFLPYCILKALFLTRRHRIDHIHLCDGFLAPVGLILKIATNSRISITVHGLDVTFNSFPYQLIIPRCITYMDRIICVSRSTFYECIKRNIPKNKSHVIPNGIDPDEFKFLKTDCQGRRRLEEIVGLSLSGKTLLLSVGRLVPRKGIRWFIENVMPFLPPHYCYIVAGDGPEFKAIQDSIVKKKLGNRVVLLGRISDKVRKWLYHESDIFIMPNVRCHGDVEGFGITAIEAGSCGLPVVASSLQGLEDAVLNGKTGYLVKAENAHAFLKSIMSMDLKKDAVRPIVNTHFNWGGISKRYHSTITKQ